MTTITPDVLIGESARMIMCTTDRPIFLTLRRLNHRVVICLTFVPIDETSKEITGSDSRRDVTPSEKWHADEAFALTEPY